MNDPNSCWKSDWNQLQNGRALITQMDEHFNELLDYFLN